MNDGRVLGMHETYTRTGSAQRHMSNDTEQEGDQTERILEQDQALVPAIEALETIEPTGSIARVQVWYMLQAYRRRPRAVVGVALAWLAEEILSASWRMDSDRPAVWMSKRRAPEGASDTEGCDL